MLETSYVPAWHMISLKTLVRGPLNGNQIVLRCFGDKFGVCRKC